MQKLILFITLLAIFTFSCQKTENKEKKPLLLVSIPPYKTLVEEIAGDYFEIQTVVPLHADPHHFEPTPKQITQIQKGQIWFRIGESFESKLLTVLNHTKSADLCEKISLITSSCCHQHEKDRHFWLSPSILKIQAETIAATLSKHFPSHKKEFDERLKKTLFNLDNLDRDVKHQIDTSHLKTFIVAHPAFAYFCNDYHCHQISLEKEGKDLRPKELEETIHRAIVEKAAFAIELPQHNSKGTKLLAQKLSIPTYSIDPYSPEYEKTIRTLSSVIKNAHEN